MKKANDQGSEIVIEKLGVGLARVWIIGESPLIYNAMSEKSRHELLMPKGKKTAAEKSQNMKHEPLEEFRNSVYRRNGDGATRLTFPACAFKCAMMDAALEVQGAKKSQIGRLVWVVGDTVDVYGVPQVHMAIVRSADMAKTPDVRTRAILERWCCMLTVRFVMPTLNETAICRLLETAGLVCGVGDFRQQKGKGNFGQFRLADKEECADIIKAGGMKQQDAALDKPTCYDSESEALFAWHNEERKRRGR